MLPIPCTATAAGNTHGLQPAAKPALDIRGGKGPGLASVQFPENTWLIIFLSVSSWVSLKFESVITAVIIILIQISNLSKYYTVDVTSLSHCGWMEGACHPPCPTQCGWGSGPLGADCCQSECASSPLSNSESPSGFTSWLDLMLGLRSCILAMGKQAKFLLERFC